jgi:hypothetical protein
MHSAIVSGIYTAVTTLTASSAIGLPTTLHRAAVGTAWSLLGSRRKELVTLPQTCWECIRNFGDWGRLWNGQKTLGGACWVLSLLPDYLFGPEPKTSTWSLHHHPQPTIIVQISHVVWILACIWILIFPLLITSHNNDWTMGLTIRAHFLTQ